MTYQQALRIHAMDMETMLDEDIKDVALCRALSPDQEWSIL